MKNVTLLAVKHATLLLIETNRSTTTLEVKQLLRDLNYFAEQDEISYFMDQAAQELPLTFTTVSGNHRAYTLPPVSAVSDDTDDDEDDILSVTITTVSPVRSITSDDDLGGVSQELYDAADVRYTSKKGELVLLYDDDDTILNLGGAVTRLSKGDGRIFYFTQPIRRELARSAHASTMGIHKNGTRSSVAVI